MIAAWMIYSTLVALLIGIAAIGIEHALRLLGYPGRWAWLGAIATSLAIPAAALLRPATVSLAPVIADGPGVTIDPALLLDLLNSTATSPSWGTANIILGLFWVAAGLALGGLLLLGQIKLRRESRDWPEEVIHGVPVRLTRDLGPAVVGCFPSVIVVPSWMRRLGNEWLRLVVSHEREHIRARDGIVLMSAVVATVLAPWNLPLWWQLRKLRDAVELDCDDRLLRSGVDMRSYSELLLEVARQGISARLPAPALSNPKSLLARRINMITQSSPKWVWPKAGLAASLATLLVVLACETPLPAAVDFNDDGTATGVSQVVAESDVDVRPTRLSGPPPRYPEMLRQAGIEGVVLLDFVIDPTGQVDSSSLTVIRSTNRAFEGPSMEVIRRSLYTPGENDGTPVAVRVQQQIGFSIAREDQIALRRNQVQQIVNGQAVDFEPPTVYVDGVRYDGSMGDLNPDQIARVEVLKGAAAVALYSAADSNGVIQIFTKQADIQVTGRRGN